jgi:chemotaxis methyl-accepting protein methylase/signal transduction histidine kinase
MKNGTAPVPPEQPRKRASAAKRRAPRNRAFTADAFPIIGLGASAGGLDAFKRFFQAMPATSGMAFVLIQHLDPTRESLTADLVGSYTKMPVVQATHGMQVEANHVYVIPPNAYLSLRARSLMLSAPDAPRSLRMAVDFFFQSLADDQGPHAIGIVLSGTASDGTLGLKAIKAAGGLTIAQDPQTAQHDGMPRSAITSGCVDHVLPAEKMAAVLLADIQYLGVRAPASTTAPDPVAAVVDMLRTQTRCDFSGYKQGTLQRRIRRRMSLRHVTQFSEYVDVLRADPAEANALRQDLLINVTRFFREPPAWEFLQERVVRPLVAVSADDATLRVWIPACASGEEAYSLAMVLTEEVEAARKHCSLQVFATDVDTEALETARTGTYADAIALQMSPQRLARFFVKSGGCYQVAASLRNTVVFAPQSLVSDPPFSRLDLISCRNLFIYLEPAVQERVLPLLHYALREGGHLFLGSAEGIGAHEDLFQTVSARWRIYRRAGKTRLDRVGLPPGDAPPSALARAVSARAQHPPALGTLAQHLLLERYAPTCVVINRAGDLLYFHGHADDYLAQPSGLPTRDIVAQARRGLRAPLRRAIVESVRNDTRVVVDAVPVRRGTAQGSVKITVEPLDAARAEADALWLVSFEETSEGRRGAASRKATLVSARDSDLVEELERELQNTRDDLQQTVEDVRAANEELMSVNEEFQSSNEELETSKEELQSLNEELATANAQLENKIAELEASNSDLDNLLTSTNIPTLFLDANLCLRRFTPTATRLFRLIPGDIGRPIEDIAPRFADPNLLRDATAVLENPVTPRTEVQAHDGRWYVRQVLPYRGRDNRTEGVVITFSDVAAEALHEARVYAESIVETVREPLLVLNEDLQVRSANHAFYETFHTTADDTIGRRLADLGNHEWDLPALQSSLGGVISAKNVLTDFALTAEFAGVGRRILRINARAIERGRTRPPLLLLAIADETERQRVQQDLHDEQDRRHAAEMVRQRHAELAHALRISTVGELASGLAHELNQPLAAIANGVEACASYVRAGTFTPGKLLTLLDEASDAALRAGTIVDHLRHFIEKGQPQFESADLGEIIRNVERLLGHELARANITLQLDLPERPIPIRADSIQIEQILVNLIQNGIDAIRTCPAGAHEIRLRAWSAKGIAEVAVTDTGSGVSADVRERLFDPFFTTKAHGLGMGMAISRSILEAHHGRIWLEDHDRESGGTTIRFSVPLSRQHRSRKKERE